jgi:tRNA(Ile)-lysidine synthase
MIEKYDMLQKGDRVVIGVSGGADSISLLHLLWSLREKYRLQLCAAHLNHGFRGEEADEDARFVESFSSQLGIPCYIRKVDVPQYRQERKVSAQLAAREVRYRFFQDIVREWGANKLALAHNRDDQAETVLLRLIRGAGLDGLCGIPPVRPGEGFVIIRPLLAVSREMIEQYCVENDLNFRTDWSNFKTVYLRNKVRLELLPYLKKEFNSQIDSLLAQTAEMLQDERNYLEQEAEKIFSELVEEVEPKKVKINLAGFKKQPVAIQRRLLRKAVIFLGGNPQDLSFNRMSELLHLIEKGRVGAIGTIKQGLVVCKGYEDFTLGEEETKPKEFFSYPLNLPGTTILPELSLIVEGKLISKSQYLLEKSMVKGGWEAFFDWEKLSLPLIIRNRRAGDRFNPLGMKGTKKLKKFFIDRKIPVQERDKIPLIVSSDGIIWVVGCQQSDLGKVTLETETVLKLKVKPLSDS